MKSKMTMSYAVIFSISILMMFVVLILASISGSKSAGLGIWYWGYTAWGMYKRNNEKLVIHHKAFMWFAIVGFSIACIILAVNHDAERYMGVSFFEVLVYGGISSGISYGLMMYFKNQLCINNDVKNDISALNIAQLKNQPVQYEGGSRMATMSSNKTSVVATETITARTEKINPNTQLVDEESIWEVAFNEFESESRRKGLWAKLLVELNGDIEKSKVQYIKERFEQLKIEKIQQLEQAKLKEADDLLKEKLAFGELKKKLSTEECIDKEYFEIKKYKSKEYYLFPNGEASIKRNEEHRIYATEAYLIDAITAYLETELLPRNGFLKAYKNLADVDTGAKKSSEPLFINRAIEKHKEEIVPNSLGAVQLKKSNGNKYFYAAFFVVCTALGIYYIYSEFSPSHPNYLTFKTKKAYEFYTHKKWGDCSSGYEDKPIMTMEFIYNNQSKEIIAKIDYEEKNQKKQDFTKLAPCSVVDENNWSCGGNPMENGKGSYSKYIMKNGVFSYEESSNAACSAKIILR